METKITSPAVKGIIISLVLIVVALIIYFSGQSQNKSIQWIQTVLFIAGIVWAAISYSKQSNGNVTFGNIFVHGFKTSVAVAAIMTIYFILFVKLIAPDFVEQVIAASRQKMTEDGKLTSDQIETGLGYTRKFFFLGGILGTIFMYAIVGAIISLISAAIAKKNPNYQPLEQ